VERFTEHLNNQDPHIKFTVEEEKDQKLPFLDTCIQLNDNGTTDTSVYRKPTHTDQYLSFKSNHPLEHKRSVVRTLLRRADKLVSRLEDKVEEEQHVKIALLQNAYPIWSMSIPEKKPRKENTQYREKTGFQVPIGIPYIKETSEHLIRIFRKYGITSYHKPMNTLRSMLVNPKDPVPEEKQCGIIYKFECKECHSTYIGETARAFKTRAKEHCSIKRSTPTAIAEHAINSRHRAEPSDFKILVKETSTQKRKIREALKIKIERPALNRDQGIEISPIYNQLLPSSSHDPSGHVTTRT
jgi:hypothetical protein